MVLQVIMQAFQYFQQDWMKKTRQEKQEDMSAFYSLPANSPGGTTTYIARAIVDLLLAGDVAREASCVLQ